MADEICFIISKLHMKHPFFPQASSEHVPGRRYGELCSGEQDLFCTNLRLEQVSAFQDVRQCRTLCSTDSFSEPALGTLDCRQAEELRPDPSAGGAADAMQAQS